MPQGRSLTRRAGTQPGTGEREKAICRRLRAGERWCCPLGERRFCGLASVKTAWRFSSLTAKKDQQDNILMLVHTEQAALSDDKRNLQRCIQATDACTLNYVRTHSAQFPNA